jgi:uncharacterized protein
MKRRNLITIIETYVNKVMNLKHGDLMIAHDYKHVDRVRNWALTIAKSEKFKDLEIVEIAALLHDIGLGQMSKGTERKNHGLVGAEIAREFLKSNSNLFSDQIELIADAITYHSLAPLIVTQHLNTLSNKGVLLEIIRDADNLDAFGAVGIMRAFTSKYYLPDYNPQNIKGIAWGLSGDGFQDKFGFESPGEQIPVSNIIDQINQQIRYYDHLHTKTARRLAEAPVQYMKDFVLQLEYEIVHS